ncbi:hypothetical protein Q1695_001006 [Nippostrongylus brasiliensis]|nr:hypothetical protein Q1695_001006 [Nippostrongylus brasiliensis]
MPEIHQPGVVELNTYLKKSSQCTRKLFENEANILLECRVCKSIFRGFLNFVSHKRTFCRSEVHDGQNAGQNQRMQDDSSARKKWTGLRRTNLVKHVMKKVDVAESPASSEENNAASFLHTLPSIRRQAVATLKTDGTTEVHMPMFKNSTADVSSDRVLLLRPQENPFRYRAMNLRMRLKEDATRIVSTDEIECVERLMKCFPDTVDPAEARCLYMTCSEVSPFGNMEALAYHMSVKHLRGIERIGKEIMCFLCSKKFTSWRVFYSHLEKDHSQVKLDHIAYRKESIEAMNRRKTKKAKQTDDAVRSRSMSPTVCSEVREHLGKNGVDSHDAEKCSITIKEEPSQKNSDHEASQESCPESLSCSQPTSTKSEETQSSDSGETKTAKIKGGSSKVRSAAPTDNATASDDGKDNTSSIGLREQRKRKIPARYRDENVLLPALEHVVLRGRTSSPVNVAPSSPEKVGVSNPTPEPKPEPKISKDVLNRLLADVVGLASREPEPLPSDEHERNSPAPTAVFRSKSSRLRRRPDWMANEEFVIVEEKKNRREGSSDRCLVSSNAKESVTS